MQDQERIGRRSFLGVAVWAIGGLITAAMGIPAIAYLVGPALRRSQSQDWIPLGPVNKVEPGTPALFKATIERQTGWISDTDEVSVYVLTEDGRDFVAMSNICTHLACRVRWIEDRQQFFCPCHNGVFDRDGQVVAGPPPRPLDRYETKIEDGRLFILGVGS
jgi:Rieske Fe-S protein